MPTIRQVWQLIQEGGNAFYIDLKDMHLYIPTVKPQYHVLHVVWQNKPYQWKVLPFWPATAPSVFISLTKPILFLPQCTRFLSSCVFR